MMHRHAISLLVSLLFPVFTFGQLARTKNDEKECAVCHVQWHQDSQAIDQLLPKLDPSTIIDGQGGVVSHEEMCISCHDGYVLDSREVFKASNHKKDLDQTHIRIQNLPLGTDDEIYCGTCHTPHALKPERTRGLAPFLRDEAVNSDLCLDCHSEQAKDHTSHPIHVQAPEDHKMPKQALFGETGSLECMTCHPIHGSQATIGVKGRDRSELCSSCHESYFNIELTDHDLTERLKNKSGSIGPSFEDQDVCAACHVNHDGAGDLMWFTWMKAEDGKNGYCLSCHVNNGLARDKTYNHRGHPVEGEKFKDNIPALNIKRGDELLCTSCHDPHQWTTSGKHKLTDANEEGTEFTSFLRMPDDAQGQLCTTCHAEQKSIDQSDHSVVREGFQKHFSLMGEINGQCSVCHDTHGAGGLKTLSNDPNLDQTRTLCESCHSEAHTPTNISGFNHPMEGVKVSGVDLPAFDGEISCMTCHDPHQWGTSRENSLTVDLQGNDANSFLRVSNWPTPELCTTCHEDQKSVLKTDHDLSDNDRNACSFCHTPHNSQVKYGLLSAWDENSGETYNEKFCLSCHQAGESAAEKIPEAWDHPHEYGTLTLNARGEGDWIDFPLFAIDKPDTIFGFVDCFTCHDPHQWSFNSDLMQPHSDNDEGDYLTSFLRNPSTKTLCTDCHGVNTLWKYNYYHDPVKRKRY